MPKDAAVAISLLEEALRTEPNYSAAHAFLSLCLHFRFARGGLREEDRIAAVYHARVAVAQGIDDATAIAVAAFVIALDGHDTNTALRLFERALELSVSNVFALSSSAVVLAWMGKTELAIERAKLALQLGPFNSFHWRSNSALAIAYFHIKQYRGCGRCGSECDRIPTRALALPTQFWRPRSCNSDMWRKQEPLRRQC